LTLQAAKVSHNDIKPANFVVDWPQRESPTISNLKIYLTDFGMADKHGGTPIYSSPEILTNPTPGVSDLYSLGRLFTFLICEDSRLFFYLIFFGIENQADLASVKTTMNSIPIMKLILKMTEVDQRKRIPIDQVIEQMEWNSDPRLSKLFRKLFCFQKDFPIQFSLFIVIQVTSNKCTTKFHKWFKKGILINY